jgi:DNA-binding transcriptional MerR regulator
MYSMKETCLKVGMNYETLKFYCNQGLIPNVKRDKNNYRVFDDNNIAWITSLSCLKKCGMSITEMKEYLALCLKGESTIPERQEILKVKKKSLLERQKEIQDSIDYINWKQDFYNDVLSGKIKYKSNLINLD